MRLLLVVMLVSCAHGQESGPATGAAGPPQPIAATPQIADGPAPVGTAPPTVAAPSLAQGDAPSPNEVCAHVAKILAQELAAAGAEGAGSGTDPECVKKAEGERAKDPAGYACDAKCIVAAKSFTDIQTCSGKCK